MKVDLIILASKNSHKALEISQMLANKQVKTLNEFKNSPEIIEDAPDFTGNAIKKAIGIAQFLSTKNLPQNTFILADDSGLEVDALRGAPGVHSARFANLDTGAPGNSSDAANNKKLLHLLAQHSRPWKARFRCVLALTPIIHSTPTNASPTCYLEEAEAATMTFDGACEGEIIPDSKGAHGFGYDPLFVPNGYSQTFAELGDDIKNQISHRAQAMRKLKAMFAS